jgi:hypothetical protein
MKNTSRPNQGFDELPDEIDIDYATAKPNRFAEQLADMQVMVVLDPDVAAVFDSAEAVNRVLRALIETMPQQQRS